MSPVVDGDVCVFLEPRGLPHFTAGERGRHAADPRPSRVGTAIDPEQSLESCCDIFLAAVRQR